MLMQLDYQSLKGMVYQVWALKSFNSNSIGLLDRQQNNQRILLLVALEMQKPSELPWNLLAEV
jgi:hypothetical protein